MIILYKILRSLTYIQSNEYSLSGGSSIIIRGQHFDNALISHDGSETDSQVEIVDSGIIQVTEGARDDGEEDNSDDDDGEEYEANCYNTDIEQYRVLLSSGDRITVTS